MSDPCPCGLTKTVVLDLDARDRVQLIAGICQNPRADGSGALCGKALGAHPVQTGAPQGSPPSVKHAGASLHGPFNSLIIRVKIENEENGQFISEKVLVDGGCEVTSLLLHYSDVVALGLVPAGNTITALVGDHAAVREMTEYTRVKVTLTFNYGEEVFCRVNPACFAAVEPNTPSQVIVGEDARILGYPALRTMGLKQDYHKNGLVRALRRL